MSGSRRKIPSRIANIAGNVKLLVLDVDGVLTDGGIIIDGSGNESKTFHVRDGHGLVMLRKAGIKIAIITGRNSKAVDRRAKELGIADVCQRCMDKVAAYEKLLMKFGITDRQVAYIGDDVVDIPLLKRVGLPVVVADAVEEAKDAATLITSARGGRGAVREVCDLILKAAGKWSEAVGR